MPPHSTHTVEITDDVVIKRYVSWDRGEHRREAAALRHLQEHAPGLAPRLLATELDGPQPWIEMTRVPGLTPAQPWTPQQLDDLVTAHRRLWSVPAETLPAQVGSPAFRPEFWRELIARSGRPSAGSGAVVYDLVRVWSDSHDVDRLAVLDHHLVLGQGDPNVANFLVDGDQVAMVDFEDAGLSHVAFEAANLVEHLANRDLGFEVLLDEFDVPAADLLLCRRLLATFWFLRLYPGGRSAARNPPGTFEAQAERLAALLNSSS